jgi:hypothetical protein
MAESNIPPADTPIADGDTAPGPAADRNGGRRTSSI